ncbi:protein-L-isoaspartate O-methyltransferase family protein [Alkalilimnicola ehrlichii MLHE-1]|uniref:Protein-L-isoaspartate O-methyltransferase n=1 Tax=Alkalilimnicola ehrlichii (strain ATCC BAA-1101 / DSM 17681 / MLHE-1) TaxID=187272 RepID=Q0A5A7_ALKEH|nr:protein-L-isoaspartate O-methyltransferase [Alkalilimnicola ehrlichii]ABI57980.1 protein-L-isoaspartate(D-aspartate) O-methyltransferase [Alkalilimnicola ehrlichii MLHE-1]
MTELDLDKARFNMVEQQVRPWDVLASDVLEVMSSVPRHAFVPEDYQRLAYSDMQLPLPCGEYMNEPKVEGRILQALAPEPGERALEIGTGSGFLAACLARMAASVVSVEIHDELVQRARTIHQARGIDNVTVQQGDAAAGFDDGRRYDCIAVTGSLPEFHEGFHRSLTIGGRLFLIVGQKPAMEALLITRVAEDQWASVSLFETVQPPLHNAPVSRRFAL